MTKLMLLLVLVVLSAGCLLETRNGNEVWAVQDDPNQPFYGTSVDTGMRVEHGHNP